MSTADPVTPQPSISTKSAAARALPWVVRLAWVAVAVVGGTALEAAVAERSAAVAWVTGIGAWAIFAMVAIAVLIPSVLSLTVARVGTPLALAAAVGSAFAGAPAADVGLLAVPALVAVAAVFTADTGRWMVQASAYGDEDRLPLRSPAATGAAAVISWFVWTAAIISGPLLLAAQNVIVGIPVTLVAIAATVFVAPRWHQMSRRWLVLVPAGLVIHDPVVLADTLMVRTDQLTGIGLARADTGAADLTGPASGHVVEISTRESVSTVFAFTPSEPNGKAIHMTSFLVAPSRPGEALKRASARKLPIT